MANIGNEECAFSASLLGAFIPLPFYLLTSNNSLTSIVTYSAIVSSVCSNWRGKQWKPFHMQTADSNRHMCCRLFIISIASTLIISAMMSGVYFNGRVLTQDGQEVRIKDAINHVFSSPAWTNKQQTAWQLYNSLTTEGFDSFWRALNIALDPEGEERTYRVIRLYFSLFSS